MLDSKKRKTQSADALDDDLEYEVDSDAAGDVASIGSASDNDDRSDRESDSNEAAVDGAAAEVKQKKQPKKALTAEEKRQKRKAHKQVTKKRKLEELGLDGADGGEADGDAVAANAETDQVLSVDQQADLFARLVRDHAPKGLSSVELDDLTLPASAFLDTTPFAHARTLAQWLPFVRQHTGRQDLAVANKEPGRPHTLVLCQSAIRVADVCRSLKQLKTKQAEVAKLFGKEKVADQRKFLRQKRVNVAVGVPGRVVALLAAPATDDSETEAAALKVDRVEQIYIDHAYRDPKRRSLVQIKEVVADLVRVLANATLRQRLLAGECRIVLF